MESYKVVAFIFVLVIANGAALKCRNCFSSKSFDECEKMGPIQECNATIVNANHEAFKADNPTLTQGNGTEFQCYRFEAARLHPNQTDTGLRAYGRGCTFLNTTFCSGWVSSLNMTCFTCTTDNCEQNPPVEPTVDPNTTTQLPGQVTTTTVSSNPTTTVSSNPTTTASSNLTTTVKPSNGAGAVTFSSLSSLGCLSILFAIVAVR